MPVPPPPFCEPFFIQATTTSGVNDMTIGFALRVKQNLPPSYMLLPPPLAREGKSSENEAGAAVCV